LQRVVAEAITDPAEQAALDEQRRRARQNGELFSTENQSAALQTVTASPLLGLARQLPTAERASLLARLGAELSEEQQIELLARVLSQLSPEALHPVEEEVTARFGGRSN